MLLKPHAATGNRIAIGLALSILLGTGNLPAQAQTMTGMGQMLKDAADAQQKQAEQNKADQEATQKDSGSSSSGADKKDDTSATKSGDDKKDDTPATKAGDDKKDDTAATKSGDDKKDDAKAADSDKKSDKADADTKSDDTKKADKDSDDKKDETADKDKDDKDKDDDKTSEEKTREKEQAKIAAQKYSPVKEAIVEINSGRAVEAIAKLEKLIGKNPKDVQARYVMAVALVRLRKYDEAASQYHEVLKLVPATSKVGQLATEGLQKIAK